MERRIWQDGRRAKRWSELTEEMGRNVSREGGISLGPKENTSSMIKVYGCYGDAVAGGSRGVKRVLTTLLHKIGVTTIS